MSRARVALIIEDEADIRQLIEEVLRQAGFEVHSASNGADGLQMVHDFNPELVTLDISMPGMDGIETAKRIRAVSDTYIIMVTARSEEIDVLQGLDSGADDYLTKPFRPRELRARVEAMLRRPRATGSSAGAAAASWTASGVDAQSATASRNDGWRQHRGMRINLGEYRVQVDDVDIDLTRSEFEILATLVREANRVHNKLELAEVLRGDDFSGNFVGEHDKRAVEVHVANLRKKIGDSVEQPRFIETVRGVGYRLTSTN